MPSSLNQPFWMPISNAVQPGQSENAIFNGAAALAGAMVGAAALAGAIAGAAGFGASGAA